MSTEQLREPDWPEGWHWSSDTRSFAVGPKGIHVQAVWIHAKEWAGKPPHVEFSLDMDKAPMTVVAAVIREWRKRGPE